MSLPQKILVVDDEADVRFIVSSMIKSRGMQVEACESLQGCMRQMQQFRPDVVILDIDLPDGSGLDALPKIKKMHPKCKVVINSAHDSEENKKLAEERGSADFLTKPLNREKLFDAIEV